MAQDAYILDPRGGHTVAKFEKQPVCGNDVGTDDRATECAAVDRDRSWRRGLVEPTARGAKPVAAQRLQVVDRVPGRDNDAIAGLEVTLSRHRQLLGAVRDGRQRPGADAGFMLPRSRQSTPSDR